MHSPEDSYLQRRLSLLEESVKRLSMSERFAFSFQRLPKGSKVIGTMTNFEKAIYTLISIKENRLEFLDLLYQAIGKEGLSWRMKFLKKRRLKKIIFGEMVMLACLEFELKKSLIERCDFDLTKKACFTVCYGYRIALF